MDLTNRKYFATSFYKFISFPLRQLLEEVLSSVS